MRLKKYNRWEIGMCVGSWKRRFDTRQKNITIFFLYKTTMNVQKAATYIKINYISQSYNQQKNLKTRKFF